MIKVVIYGSIISLATIFVSSTLKASDSVELPVLEQGELPALSADREKMIPFFEALMNERETALSSERKELSAQLRKLLGKESALYPFPNLSEATYTALVHELITMLDTHPKKAALVLYLWSYMTGIPVVGLRQGRNYYRTNNHLLPNASQVDCVDVKVALGLQELCVRNDFAESHTSPDGILHRHIEVPGDLYNSALVYRKKYLDDRHKREIHEVQRTSWKILEQELVPLKSIGNEKITQLLRGSLLKVTTDSRKPVYSFGYIRLAQNTALYLSMADGDDSDLIVSPCSKEAIRYFGFQDGLFLERGSLGTVRVDELFGKQLYFRGFFTKVPCTVENLQECTSCADSLRGLYYPHYTFAMLDDETKQTLRSGYMTEQPTYSAEKMGRFIRAFCSYVQEGGKKDSLVSRLLAYIDGQQLKIVLSDISRLESFLCNPTFSIKLTSYVGKVTDQDDRPWTAERFMAAFVMHLRCIEHQESVRIDLSDNDLGDTEVEKLGKALEDNIIPNLVSLDLSKNSIGKKGLIALITLLRRDAFITLKVGSNRVRTVPDCFDEAVADKIVWEDR